MLHSHHQRHRNTFPGVHMLSAWHPAHSMAPSIRVKALKLLRKVASTTTQLTCASFGPRTLCPLVDEEVGTKERALTRLRFGRDKPDRRKHSYRRICSSVIAANICLRTQNIHISTRYIPRLHSMCTSSWSSVVFRKQLSVNEHRALHQRART